MAPVLEVEAPLHLTELTRRVGAGWNVTRMTAKPQRQVAERLEELDPPAVLRGTWPGTRPACSASPGWAGTCARC